MSIRIVPRLWGFSIEDHRQAKGNKDIFFKRYASRAMIMATLSRIYPRKELAAIMAGVDKHLTAAKSDKVHDKIIKIEVENEKTKITKTII